MNKKIVFLSLGFVVLLVFFVFIFGIFLEKRAEKESFKRQAAISTQKIDLTRGREIAEKQAAWQEPAAAGQARQDVRQEETPKEEMTTGADTDKQKEKDSREKPEYQLRFEGPLLN